MLIRLLSPCDIVTLNSDSKLCGISLFPHSWHTHPSPVTNQGLRVSKYTQNNASSRPPDPAILSSNSAMKSSFSVSTIARLQLFVHLSGGQIPSPASGLGIRISSELIPDIARYHWHFSLQMICKTVQQCPWLNSRKIHTIIARSFESVLQFGKFWRPLRVWNCYFVKRRNLPVNSKWRMILFISTWN